MTTPVESDAFVQGTSKAPVSRWKGFAEFLYNSKEGTVLGRTAKSWMQITIFYIIFYGILAAFFAVLLILFLQTLDPYEPKWQAGDGLIGDTPGLGFRPVPSDSGSTLIWVKQKEFLEGGNSSISYVSNMNDFLIPYEAQKLSEKVIQCDPSKPKEWPVKGDGKTCFFNMASLGDCTKEKSYGYSQAQPCVLLKLNRIYNWSPKTFTGGELPRSVHDAYAKQRVTIGDGEKGNVYITCDGEDPVDQEHIGAIKLYPSVIPEHYFPFLNQPDYLSPIVMVQFLNPTPGLLVNVECKAWAHNIKHDRTNRLGQVHFEVLVDR